MFNGIGGFADDGREYVIAVDQDAGTLPPQPWSNVVAHPTFGFAATEGGPGYTWSSNSHDNRLTPWRNDPVSDPPGEAIFIRDEETGQFWSATPLPAGGGQPYTVRHGQGYSAFEHARNGLASTLLLFVPPTDEVKIFHLTLRNDSAAPRALHGDAVRGVGARRKPVPLAAARRHEPRPDTGTLFARNAFRQEFAHRVAFLDLDPGRGARRSPAIERSSRTEREARPARRDAARVAVESHRSGAWIPAAPFRSPSSSSRRRRERSSGCWVTPSTPRRRAHLVRKYRDPRAVDDALQQVRRVLGSTAGNDRRQDAGSRRWT